ncbi:MAG: glycine--tRNA ligase subunit alpha [Acidobacteriota bacterium]
MSSGGLQHTISTLTDAWIARGCSMLPPCSFEVPLATMHPQTFGRMLEGGTWRSVCAQPITRARDARHGRHPSRTARHLQLHVTWVDPPIEGLRAWLLEDLAALGIDPTQRLVQWQADALRSEALDAEGEGWRLAIDGLGVGRMTFWSRLAGRVPQHPVVDVALGVERLTMAALGVDDVFALAWQPDGGPSYHELRRQAEEELSRYVLEVAAVEPIRRLLDDLEVEARRAIAAGLARPAFELAMRMLTLLDQLECRGELESRTRARWLATISEIVREVAERHPERIGPTAEAAGPIVDAATLPGSGDSESKGASSNASKVARPPAEDLATEDSATDDPRTSDPSAGEPEVDESDAGNSTADGAESAGPEPNAAESPDQGSAEIPSTEAAPNPADANDSDSSDAESGDAASSSSAKASAKAATRAKRKTSRRGKRRTRRADPSSDEEAS